MQILIEPLKDGRYRGVLILDGEKIDTTIQARPGCCARNLLNKLMFLHGKPTEEIVLEIEGW
jgi:hypothetical protein